MAIRSKKFSAELERDGALVGRSSTLVSSEAIKNERRTRSSHAARTSPKFRDNASDASSPTGGTQLGRRSARSESKSRRRSISPLGSRVIGLPMNTERAPWTHAELCDRLGERAPSRRSALSSASHTARLRHAALGRSAAKSCPTSEVEPRINVDDGLHLGRRFETSDPQIRRCCHPIFHPIYWRDSRGRSETVSD